MSIVRTFPGAHSRLVSATFGARFVVEGVISKATVGSVIGAVVADMSPMQPLVALCDYTGADMGVAARLILAAHRKPGRPAGWPAALIVHHDHLQIWRDYAWLQGQSGNLRGVFTSLLAGEQWCAEMAAIRAEENRFLKRERLH